MSDPKDKWKSRELGALWKKKSESGTGFCSGTITYDELGQKVTKRILMFSNKEKKNPNAPDFVLYLADEQPNSSGSAGSAGSGGTSGKPAAAPKPKTASKASGPTTTGPSGPDADTPSEWET